MGKCLIVSNVEDCIRWGLEQGRCIVGVEGKEDSQVILQLVSNVKPNNKPHNSTWTLLLLLIFLSLFLRLRVVMLTRQLSLLLELYMSSVSATKDSQASALLDKALHFKYSSLSLNLFLSSAQWIFGQVLLVLFSRLKASRCSVAA